MITIDATILINLPERNDRRMRAMSDLSAHGIPYYLWMATKDEDGRKGLIKTMKSLLTYCIENGFQNVLLLEDDFKILCDNLIESISLCTDQLPPDYDLLYLGCNMHGTPTRYSPNLLKAEGMYAAHAIVYSRGTIERILLELDDSTAYDITLVKKIQKDGNSYCAYPLLLSQYAGVSDIEKREVNYEKFIEKRYAEKTKHLGN